LKNQNFKKIAELLKDQRKFAFFSMIITHRRLNINALSLTPMSELASKDKRLTRWAP